VGARSRSHPIFATGFSLLVIAAVFAPIVENWREDPVDSFPLSYYPMFTSARAETARFDYVVGYDADDRRQRIHYSAIGAGGLNQIRHQIEDAIDDRQAPRFCQRIAARVASRAGQRYRDIVRVEIVTGTYRFTDYFAGNRAPLAERLRASCPVSRR
jgi:hypothetical protein